MKLRHVSGTILRHFELHDEAGGGKTKLCFQSSSSPFSPPGLIQGGGRKKRVYFQTPPLPDPSPPTIANARPPARPPAIEYTDPIHFRHDIFFVVSTFRSSSLPFTCGFQVYIYIYTKKRVRREHRLLRVAGVVALGAARPSQERSCRAPRAPPCVGGPCVPQRLPPCGGGSAHTVLHHSRSFRKGM